MSGWQGRSMSAVQRSHVVALYGNVWDELNFGEESFSGLDEWLSVMVGSEHQFIMHFNVATGLSFTKGTLEEALEYFDLPKKEEEEGAIDQSLVNVLGLNGQSDGLSDKPEDFFPQLDRFFNNSNAPPSILVLEYADSLFPAEDGASSRPTERQIKVMFKIWARNAQIRENGHQIFVVSRRLADLDRSLLDSQLGVELIRFPKPDLAARKTFVRQLGFTGEKVKRVAYLTVGLSYRQIRKAIESCSTNLLEEYILEMRKPLLEADYGHIIEFYQPRLPLDKAVGGLDEIIVKLRSAVANMRAGRWNAVPQGIGLFGPPRTGKTLLAEGMAYEAEALYGRLKSLRSKWVGVPEALREDLRAATQELFPLVLFVDEVDGRFGQRSGYRGDGGVSEGELSAILEITSDTSLQGRVLWIFACNKPWLLDKAFRAPGRMDWRIPILPPSTLEQLVAIFKVMPFQCECQPGQDVDWEKLARSVEGYNGGDIRAITKMALEYAYGDGRELVAHADYERAIDHYLPPKVDGDVAQMMVTAVEESSSLEFLSGPVQEHLRKQRQQSQGGQGLQEALDSVDPAKVHGRSSPIDN